MIDHQNIQVILRVRPYNQNEKKVDAKLCLNVLDSQTVSISMSQEEKKFVFDFVADEQITQEELFLKVGSPLAKYCVSGFNCCLFAYGQTGSGKTHTMIGEVKSSITPQSGLQLRVMSQIFQLISHNNALEYTVKVAYFEIYNEQIFDLLNTKGRTLKIRQDLKQGTYVENLQEEQAHNLDDIIGIVTRGQANRKTAATLMNAQSSRSHSVFQVTVEMKTKNDELYTKKSSKMNFVDLAGSERQASTGATDERLKEASAINKSLHQLGNVISQLVRLNGINDTQHVSYRDSKLTHLLKDSLGGNSRTIMIATASSASNQYFETLSTLKFAQGVKQVKNQATINEKVSGGKVQQLLDEIMLLRKENERLRNTQQPMQDKPPNAQNLKYIQSAVEILSQGKYSEDQEIQNAIYILQSDPQIIEGKLQASQLNDRKKFDEEINLIRQMYEGEINLMKEKYQTLITKASIEKQNDSEIINNLESALSFLKKEIKELQDQLVEKDKEIFESKQVNRKIQHELKSIQDTYQTAVAQAQKYQMRFQQQQSEVDYLYQTVQKKAQEKSNEIYKSEPQFMTHEISQKKYELAVTEFNLSQQILKNIKDELCKHFLYSCKNDDEIQTWRRDLFNQALVGQPLHQQLDSYLKACLGNRNIDIIKQKKT